MTHAQTKGFGFRASWLTAVLALAAFCALIASAPAYAYSFQQAGQTTSSITLAYDCSDIESKPGYAVTGINFSVDGVAKGSANPSQSVGNYTISGLTAGSRYSVRVEYAYTYYGKNPNSVTLTSYCGTTPAAPKNVKFGNRVGGSSAIRLTTSAQPYYGVYNEATFTNLSSGAKTVVDGTSTSVTLSSAKSAVYSVSIRAYIMIANKKVYGAPVTKTYVCQPKLKDAKLKRSGKVQLNWAKVSGATGYDVYVSTKEKSGYKKVGSTKASKRSFTFSKFKGKKFKMYKNYYYKIVAKKGSVKSPKYDYNGFYIYTTYR